MMTDDRDKLAVLVRKERPALLSTWREQVRQLPSARGLDTPTLDDHIPNVSVTADAVRVADKVIAALGKPSRVGNHVLRLTASIGISIYPDHGDNAETLIDKTDAAMYLAKKHPLGRFVFNEPEIGDPHGSKPPATD